MRKIFKYDIPDQNAGIVGFFGEFIIKMPKDHFTLCVRKQGDHFRIWAIVDPDSPEVDIGFYSAGTGKELPDDSLRYIDTYMDGVFVWHLFEIQ